MIIKELLNEDDNSALDRAILYIKTNCSEALSYYKNSKCVLLRYLPKTNLLTGNALIIKDHPRADRLPKDSTIEAHKLVDKKLKQAGFKALRSNSLFCWPGKLDTQYGFPAVMIFPENGFKFTCSGIYDDLTDKLPMNGWASQQKYEDAINEIKKMTPKEFVYSCDFFHDDFNRALSTVNGAHGHEVYILGNYVGIGYSFYKDIIDKLF